MFKFFFDNFLINLLFLMHFLIIIFEMLVGTLTLARTDTLARNLFTFFYYG